MAQTLFTHLGVLFLTAHNASDRRPSSKSKGNKMKKCCDDGWIITIKTVNTNRVVKGKLFTNVRETETLQPCPICNVEKSSITL